jgi:hypothetical protein
MANSILVECAGQILDNVSDAMNGADGRVIRVRKPLWVYSLAPSTAPALCRLDLLAPTNGAPNNFAPVTAGMVVTWIEPPTGMAPTSVVATTFGPGPVKAITSAPWGAMVPSSEDALSVLMTQGQTVATLHFPTHKYIVGGGTYNRNSKIQLTWTLRIWSSNLQGQRTRPTDFANAINAIESHLYGASVMSDVVIPDSSREVKTRIQAWCHEMKFNTLVWTPGRVPTVFAESAQQPLEDFYATILLPGDGDQSPSFQVPVDAKV